MKVKCMRYIAFAVARRVGESGPLHSRFRTLLCAFIPMRHSAKTTLSDATSVIQRLRTLEAGNQSSADDLVTMRKL